MKINKNKFLEDVLAGLNAHPKYLQSKYFYNKEGDELFEGIMGSKDYYLTRSELEIFQQQSVAMADAVSKDDEQLDIVALGPGDSSKTIYLIEELVKRGLVDKYYPIDISENIVRSLKPLFRKKFPGIDFCGLAGEYFDRLPEVIRTSKHRRLVFFVGSTIGNFLPDKMKSFLRELKSNLQSGDLVLIGFDLKKDPRKILAAYNDSEGWTRRFNLNLLHRINTEAGSNFSIDKFAHFPTYDPDSGTCKSFLISEEDQTVDIGGSRIMFNRGEAIHMEVSQKYELKEIKRTALETGFKPVKIFLDSKKYFVDVLWEVE